MWRSLVPRRRQSYAGARRRGSRRRPSGGGRPPGGRRPPDLEQAIRVRRAVAGFGAARRGDPDRGRRPQLPGEPDQQCAARLQRPRRGPDPGLRPDRVRTSSALLASGQGAERTRPISRARSRRRTSRPPTSSARPVPERPGSDVDSAQQYLVTALRLRADGIANIAADLQPAFQSQSGQQAVNSIAAEMARFYASDVLYKDYALPAIVSALRRGRTSPVGGTNGEPINSRPVPPVTALADAHLHRRELQARVARRRRQGGPRAARP